MDVSGARLGALLRGVYDELPENLIRPAGGELRRRQFFFVVVEWIERVKEKMDGMRWGHPEKGRLGVGR